MEEVLAEERGRVPVEVATEAVVDVELGTQQAFDTRQALLAVHEVEEELGEMNA